MVMLYWHSQSLRTLTQRSFLERERSVTTVTSVPWRGKDATLTQHLFPLQGTEVTVVTERFTQCVWERERVTVQRRVCVCVWESETRSHICGLCTANTYEHHHCVTRLCSPLGLELMVKLRTLLTVFTLILKAKARNYGMGHYISNTACGVLPMLCVRWQSE